MNKNWILHKWPKLLFVEQHHKRTTKLRLKSIVRKLPSEWKKIYFDVEVLLNIYLLCFVFPNALAS